MASFPTDHDGYAPMYAWARWAVPWVLHPLVQSADALPAGAAVLEIECGTGNYICALLDSRRDLAYFGFDISEPMLHEARSRGSPVAFVPGDAGKRFPFPDQTFRLAFAVDVIHHIYDLSRFFDEANRILVPGGQLVIVTDAECTLKRRSLTRFFPETLPIDLARYPLVPQPNRPSVRGFSSSRKKKQEGGSLSMRSFWRDSRRAPFLQCDSWSPRRMQPAWLGSGRLGRGASSGCPATTCCSTLGRMSIKQPEARLHPTAAPNQWRPRVSRKRWGHPSRIPAGRARQEARWVGTAQGGGTPCSLDA